MDEDLRAHHQEREATRQTLAEKLTAWEIVGFIRPGWTLELDSGDDSWRTDFQVTHTGEHYFLTEAEFEMYEAGVDDWRSRPC